MAPPLRAHEFHHSSLEDVAPDLAYAYDVTRGHGVDGHRDGLVVGNLLASYAHLRGTGGSDWPARFVAFARAVRDEVAGRETAATERAAGSASPVRMTASCGGLKSMWPPSRWMATTMTPNR